VQAECFLTGEALPSDIVVRRFESRERISSLFEASVEFATEDVHFDAEAALRKSALLTIRTPQHERVVHGIVDEVHFVGTTGTHLHFRLLLKPSLAALSYREDSRIYQDKSPVDVIKDVLAAGGVDEGVDWRLAESYGPREFIVQYRESELNFIERLMEDEGIFYFFEHLADGHRLVIADQEDAFRPPDGQEELRFAMTQGVDAESTAPLAVFEREKRLRPTKVLLRDFDFEKPQAKPEATQPAEGAWPLSYYEYPAGFRKDDDGARRARARMRALRRDADVSRGEAIGTGLTPGVPFQVEGAAEPCNNGAFVVTELGMSGEQGVDEGKENFAARSRFECIPKGATFAPPRRAHRPRIRGLQPAVVTGPSNEAEAIHVDEYGRIKVRFFWDRAGVANDTSSCWLRVVQLGIGGSMILPRVGWEVAVAFENGDPDRPFVVGRIYNKKHAPPVGLPGSAACGSMKSMSSPGGAGSNAFTADDSGGKQAFGLSGQKDMNTSVGADKVETIAVNEDISVTANLSSSVGGTETISIGGNQTIDCGDAYQISIGGAQTISVGGNEDTGAKPNMVDSIGGARSYSIGGNRTTIQNGVRTLITGAITRNVGAVQLNLCLASMNDGVGADYTENVGAVKVELVNGTSAEEVSGTKDMTSLAAEAHIVANYSSEAPSIVRLIGGLHMRKAGGNVEISGAQIALVGGVGHFKAGGGALKLNGGPILMSGGTVSIKAAAIITKTAGSLKLG
jgi:type VI secretion system secreted protein VgrG